MNQTTNNTKLRRTLRSRLHITPTELLFMFLGSTLTSIATIYLLDPASLVTGGVSGLAIMVKALSMRFLGFEIPLWLSNLILNVPIFLFAYYTDGFESICRSGICWLIMTVEFYLFPEKNLIGDNLLLSSLYGGILFGAGAGFLLMSHCTSGGTDLLAMSIHHYLRQYTIARIMQVLDGVIVLAGLAVFAVDHTLYALISVFIMGYIADYIVASGKTAKMALIISDCSEDIARSVMEEMDRGVTGLRGRGMYTGRDRTILLCICSSKDIVSIKDIVRQYDPSAFFIITSVNEALGEGFVEKWS